MFAARRREAGLRAPIRISKDWTMRLAEVMVRMRRTRRSRAPHPRFERVGSGILDPVPTLSRVSRNPSAVPAFGHHPFELPAR